RESQDRQGAWPRRAAIDTAARRRSDRMSVLMHRRSFLTLLGGAAAAWPVGAQGQQRSMPVIGVLSSTTPAVFASRHAAFMQGLKEAGFVEGQNVVITWRWAGDQYGRLPYLAADLV